MIGCGGVESISYRLVCVYVIALVKRARLFAAARTLIFTELQRINSQTMKELTTIFEIGRMALCSFSYRLIDGGLLSC
jgi:hypothetical protein